MFVPTAAKKSHRVPDQALTFGGRKKAEVRFLRFWDFGVPISGRASQNSAQNGSCSNASAPLPPRRFITTNESTCAFVLRRLRGRPVSEPSGLVVNNGTQQFAVIMI